MKAILGIKSNRGLANHIEKLKGLGTLSRQGTFDGYWIVHFNENI